jgi:hypothetical protein
MSGALHSTIEGMRRRRVLTTGLEDLSANRADYKPIKIWPSINVKKKDLEIVIINFL